MPFFQHLESRTPLPPETPHFKMMCAKYSIQRKRKQAQARLGSLQYFLLPGLFLLNRLTLAEEDSNFTLSIKVFLMAAGETFSWSAKHCSSLLKTENGLTNQRTQLKGCVRGDFFLLCASIPCPDAGCLHSIDEQ